MIFFYTIFRVIISSGLTTISYNPGRFNAFAVALIGIVYYVVKFVMRLAEERKKNVTNCDSQLARLHAYQLFRVDFYSVAILVLWLWIVRPHSFHARCLWVFFPDRNTMIVNTWNWFYPKIPFIVFWVFMTGTSETM